MANWTINSKTAKTAWTDTDSLVIQESGNTVKKLALSVLRKIIPAANSTTAFQVMKADGTTPVLTVDTSSNRALVNQGTQSTAAALDIGASGVGFALRRAAGNASMQLIRHNGTDAAPTAVSSGNLVADVNYRGFGATIYTTGASDQVVAEENFTDTSSACSRRFYTTPTGAVSPLESLRITGAGAVYFPRIATTASAANAYLDSGTANSLLRSTSSAKYKTDVKDLVDSSMLDDLRPIVYKSNPETVPNDDPTKEHYGFIAEELDKVDSKLVHYIKDEEGKEIPDGVQYERVVVLLVKRIHELEARLAKAGI